MVERVSIAIWGAGGKMGRRIAALAAEDPGFEIVAGVESENSEFLGKSVGELIQRPEISAPIGTEPQLKENTVIIEFSSPEGSSAAAQFARERKLPLVSGTTGLTEKHLALFREVSSEIPLLYSPNMSFGVNAMFWLARQMARILGDDFDIEIFEIHHRHKKDAPSGTALRLAGEVATALNWDSEKVFITDRSSSHKPRGDMEIGIQAARGGDVPGEHTLFFFGDGERLELTHRAGTRDIFARGALRAARWLADKGPGFYSMFDVLSSKLGT